jgi:ribose transport system substrate-binding protein
MANGKRVDLFSSQLSRRSVVKRAAALGLAVPAAINMPNIIRAQDDVIEIAYLTPGLNVPFWRYLSDGIKQAAERSGQAVEVTDYDSRNDAATQLQNAQDAITRNVDAIIISPTDSSTAPAVLEVAAEAGIPVVIADIGTDSGEYVSFVISSNEGGAFEAGEVLVREMEERGWGGEDVVMITISQSRINGQNRTRGITSAVEEGGSEIVQYLESQDYTRAEAQSQALDLLTANPNARGFFTQHDEATLGAWTAIEDSGRQEVIILVGFDGSPESVELIRQGHLRAASMQQPVLMGRMAMEVALAHLNGEAVDEETEVPTILVTPDNLSEVEEQLADTVFPVDEQAETDDEGDGDEEEE